MASHHPSEVETATDSVASSPRSDNHRWHPEDARLRFMCSFGGRILPRPLDNQLRYVGGETRIVSVHRSITFSALLAKLSKLSNTPDATVKYQLPNEDLDSLISVTTDEDVENMIEEYDRLLAQTSSAPNSKTVQRLRLFLFPSRSPASSISSLLDGSIKRQTWFLDALNGGLERGRSEVSSLVSEVPDYLFGLDNSEEQKPKARPALSENVSVVSDPGSPAPPSSSPYCSTSLAIPDHLPHVKTRPEIQAPVGTKQPHQMEGEPPIPQVAPPTAPAARGADPGWHYLPESQLPGSAMHPVSVYYIPAGNVPVQPVPMQVPYMQRVPSPVPTMGLHHRVPVPGYGGGVPVGRPGDVRPVAAGQGYDLPCAGVIPAEGVAHPMMYYAAARNATGMVTAYPPVGMQDLHGNADVPIGRTSQNL
ncbi:hypothetical protein ACLOJK_039774 [Asimina triloba]